MVGGGRSPVEPVCGAKIPANRDNNREFLKKRPPRPKTARQTHDSSVGYKEIPYRPEQGINSSEQGKMRAFGRRTRNIGRRCRFPAGIDPGFPWRNDHSCASICAGVCEGKFRISLTEAGQCISEIVPNFDPIPDGNQQPHAQPVYRRRVSTPIGIVRR